VTSWARNFATSIADPDVCYFIAHFLMHQRQNQEEKLCGMSVRKFAVLTDDSQCRYWNGDQVFRRKA
jgi:hypothetical protein